MSSAPPLWPQGNVQNPITQSGRVVINAAKDEYSIQSRRQQLREYDSAYANSEKNKLIWTGNDSDDNFSIMAHEIAVHDSKRDFEARLARHESVQVITSANGLSMADYRILSSPFQAPRIGFVGIAGTRARHNESSLIANETDCVVQIGGLCTIINNGPLKIEVGEWVCWDFPIPEQIFSKTNVPIDNSNYNRQRQQGIPDGKAQFIVRGFNAFMKSLLHGCLEDVDDLADETVLKSDISRMKIANPEDGSALQRLETFTKFVEDGDVADNTARALTMAQHLKSPMLRSVSQDVLRGQHIANAVTAGRVFGKAMSTALPGQQLDILLGSHYMSVSLSFAWWLTTSIIRCIPLIFFVGLCLFDDNDNPNLAPYSIRIQQNHAQATAVPSLYVDSSIEIWIRSLCPVSLLAVACVTFIKPEQTLSVDSQHKKYLLLSRILGISMLDSLVVVTSAFAYSEANVYSNNWYITASISAADLAQAFGNIMAYTELAMVSKRKSQKWNNLDVQIVFGFAVQSGFCTTRCVASCLHTIHTIQRCRFTNTENECETTLMIAICLLVGLLYFVTIEFVDYTFNHNFVDTNVSIVKSLWRQFSLLPPAVTLFGIDRNATAHARIAGSAGVTAVSIIVMSMATTLSTFFDPDTFKVVTKETESNAMYLGNQPVAASVSGAYPLVYRPAQMLRRPVHTKVK